MAAYLIEKTTDKVRVNTIENIKTDELKLTEIKMKLHIVYWYSKREQIHSFFKWPKADVVFLLSPIFCR